MKKIAFSLLVTAFFLAQSLHAQFVINIVNESNTGSVSGGASTLNLSGGSNSWGGGGSTAVGNFTWTSTESAGTGSYAFNWSPSGFSGVTLNFGTSLSTLTNLSISGSGNIRGYDGSYLGGTTFFPSGAPSLTIHATAIPEPSTYAAILGALALCFIGYRRFRSA